jgi:lipoprotein-anchoring transpeptidase ErfK/SrfK
MITFLRMRFVSCAACLLAALAIGSASAAPTAIGSCARGERGIGGERVAYAAIARRQTLVYRSPRGRRLASFGAVNANGYATVFGVRRVVLTRHCEIAWYRVRLPMRPNGIEGYVAVDDVNLIRVHRRIIVDLSKRELTLYRDGRPVLRASVAIGAPGTPTPIGHYYVNQRLITTDPSGPYGPGAIGISAFSDVLKGWTQGGPIAIHGTNEPSSIGAAASHGCVRLRNDVLRKVFAVTAAGTPVIIHV